jgi:maltose alpha-D-glucosyltransferase/alpha-amylase
LPVALATGGREVPPRAVIARLDAAEGEAALVEALEDPGASREFLRAVLHGGRGQGSGGDGGTILATPLGEGHEGGGVPEPEPRSVGGGHASAIVCFGERHLLKMFRALENGPSPELEVTAHLARYAPGLAPAPESVIEYRRARDGAATVGVVLGYVPNEGTARTQACDELRRYYERVLSTARDWPAPPRCHPCAASRIGQGPPVELLSLIGTYLETSARIVERTAELHHALAQGDDPAFTPEPYSTLDLRSKYQSYRNLVGKTLRLLRARRHLVPPEDLAIADRILDGEARILRSFDTFLVQHPDATRIRIHGDFHLGQILHAGRDLVIIDFEGGHERSLAERRRKRSALRDVAGLVGSLHDCAFSVLMDPQVVRVEDRAALAPWAEQWQAWTATAFLGRYLARAGDASFVPRAPEQRETLLQNIIVEGAFRVLYRDLRHGHGMTVPLHALAYFLEV